MDLSIIIVAFRNQEKLRVTLNAVFRSQTDYSYEVIVVDNDSADGTAEMLIREYPQVILIRSGNNGFSKGNNIGFARSKGKYILALNPDTAIENNVLQECIALLDSRADIGVVGCKLIKEDGTLDLACRRSIPNLRNSFFRFTKLSFLFPKNKTFAEYNLTYGDENKEGQVGAVSGAFLMIRRSVIEKLDIFFDEDYFMYSEDIDLCLRVTRAGYKVWYYPKVMTLHYKGQSSRKVSTQSLYWFHKYMWVFYRKHYHKDYPFIVNWAVFAGIWSRFLFLYIANIFRRNPYVSK